VIRDNHDYDQYFFNTLTIICKNKFNLSSKTYAVIMAGGAGTRFWPLSRRRMPKQVLSIIGTNSLLQDTTSRLEGLVPKERTLVVTNRQQLKVVASQQPDLGKENFLIEPTPRNTAPCIGLAAIHIRKIDPDGIMLVLPSDHRIKNVPAFQDIVRRGIEVVERFDPLVTIGIPPARPETGYGYIQFEPPGDKLPSGVHRVRAFAEKPNLETARRFIKSGDFYWNSGIFLWRAERILAEMEEHLPEQYHQLHQIEAAVGSPEFEQVLSNRYKRIRPISIDYGIMEVSSASIFMLAGDFGWSDVGSWDELYRISAKGRDGNVCVGETVTIDARNDYIYSPDKLTAVIGLNDILVVNTHTTTLICHRDRAQDVKAVVDELRKTGRKKYL